MPDGFRPYSDPGGHFTIRYPADWRARPGKGGVTFFAPAGQVFTDNLAVQYANLPERNLKELMNGVAVGMGRSMKDFQVETSEPAQFGDREAYLLVFTGSRPDHPAIKLQMAQVVLADGPMLYMFGFATTADRWDQSWPLGQQMLASFKPGPLSQSLRIEPAAVKRAGVLTKI